MVSIWCLGLTTAILATSVAVAQANLYDTYDKPIRECEPIEVEMCKGLGYNYTGGPNFLQEEFYTQQDAVTQLYTYAPLIQSGCSKLLKPFLCTAYVPMCDIQVRNLIGPCRTVCENVKARCQPILKQVGLPWPVALNCSLFPEKNEGEIMCMELPDADPTLSTHATTTKSEFRSSLPAKNLPPQCINKKDPTAYKLVNSTRKCHPRCDVDILFTHSQKHFTEIWMAIWSAFSLLFSLLTVITFFLDTRQFPYPLRGIIFLSLSYTMYTLGYLVRLVAGRQLVICDSDGLMTQGLDNTNCAAIFLLLYYFITSAALWWVVFSFTWLLSAGFKWSHEAIELYSSYFHLVAWGIPAIQSITVVILRDVSVEELTGLCFVGTNNPNSLLGFVIGPTAAYLFLGTGLLLAGYIVSFCHSKKQEKKPNDIMEVLMVRIGLFSLFYTVPTTCLLACYFYEYLNNMSWEDASSSSMPSKEIFTLKSFSCLLPGITSGLTILTCKNFDTWSMVCGRPCLKKYLTESKRSIHHSCSSTQHSSGSTQRSNNSTKSFSNSNNNNNTLVRQISPLKSLSVRQTSPPSQFSVGRSYNYRHVSLSPTLRPSTRFPGEYHV